MTLHPLQFSLGQVSESAELAADCWRRNPDDWSSFRLALDSFLPSTARAHPPEVDTLQCP